MNSLTQNCNTLPYFGHNSVVVAQMTHFTPSLSLGQSTYKERVGFVLHIQCGYCSASYVCKTGSRLYKRILNTEEHHKWASTWNTTNTLL